MVEDPKRKFKEDEERERKNGGEGMSEGAGEKLKRRGMKWVQVH